MPAKDISLANPQGKGTLALLDDLTKFNQYKIQQKNVPEWLADYFTSLLVVGASFSFKPIINKTYYLYLDNQQWKLSLIEPQLWQNCPYEYFAECCMHEDRTWSLLPINNWEDHPNLVKSITAIKNEFVNSLNHEAPILSTLPYFAEQLPYYQRLCAFALSNSLKASLQLQLGHENSHSINGIKLLRQANNENLLKISNSS